MTRQNILFFVLALLFLSLNSVLAYEGSHVHLLAKQEVQQSISGTVVDEAGNALPDVTVTNLSTNQETVTDIDGNFSIEGKEGDTLSFFLIEFQDTQATLGSETTLKITMPYMEMVLTAVFIARPEIEDVETIPCWNAARLLSSTEYDSRFETYELDSLVTWQGNIKRQTKSVAIIVQRDKLLAVSNGEYQLDISNSLQKIYNLCDDQIYKNQPVVGTGTGFIIGEDIMVTANHVFEADIDNYAVVFGYELTASGELRSRVKASEIFYPKKIVTRYDDLDVVTFTVDRPFERPKLSWETSLDLEEENEIYMIGNPSGLPTKIALNADIIENKASQFFYTSLDSFQGNSGSPIFNLCTNKVIGILVSGELDYEYNGNCYKTTLCKYPYCKGEKVIRIETIMNN